MSDPAAPAPELPSTSVDAAPAADTGPVKAENGEAKVNGASVLSEEPTGHKVFAGNLSYSTTDETLKEFFKEHESDIVETHLVRRGARPAGYAFLTFKTLESAQEAVTSLSGKELDGRTVAVEIAKPAEEKERKPRAPRKPKSPKSSATGGVRRVGEVTEEEAEGGAPTEARIDQPASVAEGEQVPKKKKRNNNRKTKARRAAAEGAETGDAAPATNGAPLEVNGTAKPEGDVTGTEGKGRGRRAPRDRKPRTDRPERVKRPTGTDPEGTPSPNMLFVANLPFTVTDEQLSALFSEAGLTVVSARIVRRRYQNRRSKGFGFVDVVDNEGQKKGIESVNGKDIDGREVVVKVAVNSQVEAHEADEAAHAEENKENVAVHQEGVTV